MLSLNSVLAYISFMLAIIAILLNLLHQNFMEVPALCELRRRLTRRLTILIMVYFLPIWGIIWRPIIMAFLFNDSQKGESIFIKFLILYLAVVSLFFGVVALYGWNRFQRTLLKTLCGIEVDRMIDEL
ncbi:MAG: hypothetical protein KKE12_20945 [Proteobacteria bacterium]|nr:hypothetical protein [Pseudomonadota bacterium]